jgi:glyoxylase-like metal-dependent hydrolase (beta-lactamase superfamily II)
VRAVHRAIAPGVVLVDTGYVHDGVAAAYVVRGRRSAAVVETGAASAVPRILAALAAEGVARDEVTEVVVTHVHLDHAGGAGALLAALPRARLVVHPRGARHLIDPAKLVAGSVAVYGEARFRELYGEIVPAPAERVVEAGEGFALDLGERPLRLLDAPGHARHHFVVLDEATRGFFTGDAFGISYRETDARGVPFLFPTTTPVQLDPPAFHATIDRMVAERPERMYLTHFGMIEGDVGAAAERLHAALEEHVRLPAPRRRGPGGTRRSWARSRASSCAASPRTARPSGGRRRSRSSGRISISTRRGSASGSTPRRAEQEGPAPTGRGPVSPAAATRADFGWGQPPDGGISSAPCATGATTPSRSA